MQLLYFVLTCCQCDPDYTGYFLKLFEFLSLLLCTTAILEFLHLLPLPWLLFNSAFFSFQFLSFQFPHGIFKDSLTLSLSPVKDFLRCVSPDLFDMLPLIVYHFLALSFSNRYCRD